MKVILSLIFIILIQPHLFAQIDLVPYRVKNKWGYSDFEQNIKITTKYDSVDVFEYFKPLGIEIALVKKDNKYGLIDKNEKFIIPLKYSMIIEEGRTGNMWNHETSNFLVKKGNKFGIISDKNSIIIPIIYDTLFIKDNESHNGYIYFGKRNNKYYKLSQNTKDVEVDKAYFDKRSNTSLAIAPDYYDYNDVNSNTINKWKNDYILQNKINVDSMSKAIIMDDCFFFITYNKDKKGMIGQIINNNKRYNFNIPQQYDEILDYKKKSKFNNEEFIFLVKKNGHIAVINDQDSLIMPYKPYEYKDFTPYSIYLKKDSLFGFFYFEDPIYIEPKYEYIRPIISMGILKVKKLGKWGYINNKGVEYFRD